MFICSLNIYINIKRDYLDRCDVSILIVCYVLNSATHGGKEGGTDQCLDVDIETIKHSVGRQNTTLEHKQ